MHNEELKAMMREVAREVFREELARYLQTGLAVLTDDPSTMADQMDNEADVDDAFMLLEQHSDVMESWMTWAADESDEAVWQDFDGR